MKNNFILLAALVLSSFSFAGLANAYTADPHKDLYQLFEAAFTEAYGQKACQGQAVCTIEVMEAECLRYGSCTFTFAVGHECKVAEIGSSHPLKIKAYMILRRAFNSQIGTMTKFGPRYRPNFATAAPMSCSHDRAYDSYTCE